MRKKDEEIITLKKPVDIPLKKTRSNLKIKAVNINEIGNKIEESKNIEKKNFNEDKSNCIPNKSINDEINHLESKLEDHKYSNDVKEEIADISLQSEFNKDSFGIGEKMKDEYNTEIKNILKTQNKY